MKNETIEEAAWKYGRLNASGRFVEPKKIAFEDGAKWQQERSYSEEDLREAFRIGFNVGYNDAESPSYLTFNKWFEQFKKKIV